jgi:Cytochrome P450
VRLAIRDTVLPHGGGKNGDEPVYVPKGSFVSYAVYTMHRRTDLFGADADEFRPERWEGQIYGWVSFLHTFPFSLFDIFNAHTAA